MEKRRVDLLRESADGRLLHIKLQSTNDPSMALRMVEYGVKVAQLHGQYPKEVRYVGPGPLRIGERISPQR